MPRKVANLSGVAKVAANGLRLIPRKEACIYIGRSERTFDRDKTIPRVKIGGRWFASTTALDAWMRERGLA